MSQAGYTPIQLYYSTTAAATPSAGNLAAGELAVNITDGKLFYKDNGGVVQVLATKGAGTIGGSNTQVQYNSSGALAGSANMTFDGTTLTAAGLAGPHNGTVGATTPNTGAFTTLSASSTVSGAGFSTYLASPPAIGGTAANTGAFTTLAASGAVTLSGGTANGVAYLNGSKVLTTGSALTYNGSTFSIAGTAATTSQVLNSTGSTTGATYGRWFNTGSDLVWGIESSAGGALATGSSAYAAVLYTNSGVPLQLGTAGTIKATLDVAGLFALGLIPSTWFSNRKAIQINNAGSSIAGFSGGGLTEIRNNTYLNSAGSEIYTSSTAASVYTISGSQHFWYSAPSGTAGNAATFTQTLAVDKDKSFSLQGASPQSGTGITFPATQNASSDANTLDDYEEGTWTPAPIATFGSLSYSGVINQYGRYVKIGNMVQCWFKLTFTITGAGNTGISGLPFNINLGSMTGIQIGGVAREDGSTGILYQVEGFTSGNTYFQVLRSYNNISLPSGTFSIGGVFTYQTT